jgi:MFS family permease
MFSMNFTVFVPLLAKVVFHGKVNKVALFQVLLGTGSLLGSILAARRPAPSGRVIVIAAFTMSAGLGGLAIAPWEPLAWVLLPVTGVGFISFMLTSNATLQLSSQPAMRGRVMALYGFVFAGVTPFGGPLVGWVADRFGARQSVGVGGFAAMVAAFAALWSMNRGRLNPGITA